MKPIYTQLFKSGTSLSVACCAALSAMLGAAPAFADRWNQEAATQTPIKHVVIIIPENRTFDNYFGTYPKAANIPGEQSWVGVSAPQFVARDGRRRPIPQPVE